jgi:hypothetical protein
MSNVLLRTLLDQMTCVDCPGPGLPFLLCSGAFYPIAQTPAQASNPLTDPGLRALSAHAGKE